MLCQFRGLDDMTVSQKHSGFFRAVDLGEVVGCLEDLITYFEQPEDDMGTRVPTNVIYFVFYSFF